ncbi:MAG: excinuclease ABC subunit UvrC [Clostridia bacterium]|nr:excinuclease ABC subunit UvrC [Clostridia bacterium]
MNGEDNLSRLKRLKTKANKLPKTPGVYIMRNKSGDIIYIGKAKALKNRVTQYFGAGNQHPEKVRKMVSNVEDFDFVLCESEFEALILENSLIKQNQPKYNILLKDDKGYHYIMITGDKWRRITASKDTADRRAKYIGPYYSSLVVKDTVDETVRTFKLPDCNRSFDKPSKPCLNFHIGRCDAPCRGKIPLSEYNETVDSAIAFIKGGFSADILDELRERMQAASDNLNFEYAAKLRDRINAINKLREKQRVVMCAYPSQDVFASVSSSGSVGVGVLVFRNSRLTDKKVFFFDGEYDKGELYGEFLRRYYDGEKDIPKRILLDAPADDGELISEWLSSLSGRKAELLVPERGEQKKLVEMCRGNVAENMAQRVGRTGERTSILSLLKDMFGLKATPEVIEAFDISNTGGQENVAGMVVFSGGKPERGSYRRFKIKGFSGQDDYRSMAEVLDRRFSEYEKGTDKGFSRLPDLILLDGAAGQISAVLPVMEAHGIDLPVFGMVKDGKHKTRAIATTGDDIEIKGNRAVFGFITEIQDEVHRFAISYHRKKRSERMLGSQLLEIPGVGEKTLKALIKHFKTVSAVKAASYEELCEVKGVTKTAARNIREHFEDK